MKIIVTAVGSTGDVYPFLAVGRLLKERAGHDVLAVANERFRARAEAAGLEFLPHGTTEDYERSITPPSANLKNPFALLRGAANLMEYNFFKPIAPTFDAVAERRGSGALIIGHGVSFGARLARDAFSLPMISGILSPTGVPGNKDYGFGALLQRIGSAACTARINRFCSERGLPRIRSVDGWSLSPDAVAALFPAFFDARSESWPAHVAAAGFQTFDAEGDDDRDREALAFLERGPAVLFTSGTPIRTAHAFFREAAETCRRLGIRGLLVTDYAAQVPEPLPGSVRRVPYVSFRRAFPLCTAVVHHGGVGTGFECLRAGVSQLAAPQIADQHWNAARLRELGAADVLPMNKFTADRAAPKLRALLENGALRERCRELKRKMEEDDGGEKLIGLVEELLKKHRRNR